MGAPITARHVARTYLERCLIGTAAGRRLGTVRELAAAACVSHVTMWHAVRELAAQGRLCSRHGSGIRVADPSTGGTDPAIRSSRQGGTLWQRVAHEIGQQLLQQPLTPGGTLPLPKELVQRFGVGHRTLMRALEYLSNEGVLERCRRTYRLRSAVPRRFNGQLLFVAPVDDTGTVKFVSERNVDLYRAVERECARLGLELEIAGLRYGGEIPGERMASAIGALVWNTGAVGQTVPAVVRSLGAYPGCKPVALLDETGDLRICSGQGLPGTVRVILMAGGETCGLTAGHFLLAQGHRQVAFFSAVHGAPWSRNRVRGVERSFGAAGVAHGVRRFTIDNSVSPGDLVERSRRTYESAQRRLARRLTAGSRESAFGGRLLSSLSRHVPTVFDRELLRDSLWPLFERAAADPAITAWIGAEDWMALEALDFVRSRDLDVAVLGFDDCVEASLSKLTSYNFNVAAAVRASLAHVVSPGHGLGRHVQPVMTVEGYLVERASTMGRGRRGRGRGDGSGSAAGVLDGSLSGVVTSLPVTGSCSSTASGRTAPSQSRS